jgi:hypothetical protein
MRFHNFDYFIDFWQLQQTLLLTEIDRFSAIHDRIDGVFDINKQILLCILGQQHLLNHIMIQNTPSQSSIHLNQLINHLFLYRIHKALEIKQFVLLKIKAEYYRELIIKWMTSALIIVCLGRHITMNIGLPLTILIITLQSTKIINALL